MECIYIYAVILVFIASGCVGQEETTPIFKTINGEVVIAAENYSFKGGTVGEWYLDSTLEDCLDGYYMQASNYKPADNSHLKFSASLANLSYIIQFNEPGTYYMHLRTYAKDHTQNGFFATINGKEINYGGANPLEPAKKAYYIYVYQANKWYWYTDGGGAETRRLKVHFEVLSPGQDTLTIYRREAGSRIDHIWLTQHVNSPRQTSYLNLPSHKNFIVTDTTTNTRNVKAQGNTKIKIYPNPSKQKLFLACDNLSGKISKVELFNSSGIKIYRNAHGLVFPCQIDISSYLPGIYMIRIYTEGKYLTNKIIIN
jgi:hypothetical protein